MERLWRAMAAQLAQRDELLRAGARHVGWKLGIGERERIDGSIAVGHLTSATVLRQGDTYVATDAVDLRADAELAIAIGQVRRYAAALEIIDLAVLDGEPDSVVASNVFHRAVAFGAWSTSVPENPHGALAVNGEVRAAAEAAGDVEERLAAAARILEAVGEELRLGDVVITGSIVQAPLQIGDEVEAEIRRLGAVALSIR